MTSPTAEPGRIVVRDRLTDAEVGAIDALRHAVSEADGAQPLSEHVWLHVRHGGEGPDRNLLLYTGSTAGPQSLAGYAHLDPTDPVDGASAEVMVHPDHRRHGLGRALVAAVLAQTPGRLRLWAHGDSPAARALAESLGFEQVRRLLQMRRSLFALIPPVDLPAGVELRTFRPGADDAAWLELNARAFAHHPEQGHWTMSDLHARMAEPWFDPSGFLIAEEAGRMEAFHWTKIHGGGPASHPVDGEGEPHHHDPIGEVYVVGVDPDQGGRGLGRAVTVAGLHRLRAAGLEQVMLYVEADNEAAVRLYTSLGFALWGSDVMFRSPAS